MDKWLKRVNPPSRETPSASTSRPTIDDAPAGDSNPGCSYESLDQGASSKLNLSGNKLGDSGVKQISVLLENPHFKLQRLLLSDCGITGEGYSTLTSALKSNPSPLVELDLRGNDPGDSGVELLLDLHNLLYVKNLQTLKLLKSDAAEEACVYLTSVLGINPLLLTELDLSGKKPGDSGVKQLPALLEDSHCTLKKLKSNPSHLKELNLSENKLGDSGVKHISVLLENPHCKLEKLLLSDCGITGEGYSTLTSALKSNLSHLVELDLRGNDPGDSGMKLLTDLHNLLHGKKLPTLRLLKRDAAEKACVYLTSVLGTNPLLLTELDLNGKKPGDSGVKRFCALLEDSHCRLKTIKLNNSNITEEGCDALTSALSSNPSHLRELNLSGNTIGDSGVDYISALLQNPYCKLQRLLLNDSSISEKGCATLTSALRSNPSHLIELHLKGNQLGDSGVKQISALLKDPNYKLQKLELDPDLLKPFRGVMNVMTNLPGASAVSSFVTSWLPGKQEPESDSSAQQGKADVGSARDQAEQESDTTSGVTTSEADVAHAGHLPEDNGSTV
ncbi:ribonuclease inhibitor-like [Clupea harengus]|uniref:Ribonuclease inhibitor-like n=1 Tax=Clupea harengus TaxID=7950 RepID=A0A8M1K9Q6_CLUHA|nr:ribonuclease inhibitor-like [Clupea harengus]